MQAPVLSNVQGLTSLEQMENTLAETEENNAMTYTLGITRYFSIPYQTQRRKIGAYFLVQITNAFAWLRCV